MGRVDEYRAELRALPARRWPAYLGERSGLPGPRGNIELGQAVADEGDPAMFDRLIATDDEYPVFCGVVGLGRLLADGAGPVAEKRLRQHATDARWRVREAVAMALQRLGDTDRSPTTATSSGSSGRTGARRDWPSFSDRPVLVTGCRAARPRCRPTCAGGPFGSARRPWLRLASDS